MFLSAQAKLLRQRLQICARRDQAPSLAITGFDARHCIFRANATAADLDYTDRSLTSLFNAQMFTERLGKRLAAMRAEHAALSFGPFTTHKHDALPPGRPCYRLFARHSRPTSPLFLPLTYSFL